MYEYAMLSIEFHQADLRQRGESNNKKMKNVQRKGGGGGDTLNLGKVRGDGVTYKGQAEEGKIRRGVGGMGGCINPSFLNGGHKYKGFGNGQGRFGQW